MKHIRCAVCGKDIHYTQAVHVRVHEMTDVYRFRTHPMEYFDVCRECYENMRGGGTGGQESPE